MLFLHLSEFKLYSKIILGIHMSSATDRIVEGVGKCSGVIWAVWVFDPIHFNIVYKLQTAQKFARSSKEQVSFNLSINILAKDGAILVPMAVLLSLSHVYVILATQQELV